MRPREARQAPWGWMVALAAVVVAIAGLPLPVMDVDAAQYAAMTREMLARGDWLHFTDRGRPYLDKPPLVFWTAGVSFWLFGIGHVTYKLPSMVAAVVAVFATARLGTLLHGAATGRMAAAMLATTVGMFLMVSDVRTDTLLMGAVAVALWQGAAYAESGHLRHAGIWGIAVGAGLLAKGPLGLAVPLIALVFHCVAKQRPRLLWRGPVLVVVPLVVMAMLAPMLVGLYQQHGWLGVKFYMWTQSFGRLTGENTWRNQSGPLFFLHTLPWLFAPWGLLVVLGLVQIARTMVRRTVIASDVLLVGAFLPGLLAISASHYKLPHYLYVVFPAAAVIAARALDAWPAGRAHRWLSAAQVATAALLLAGTLILLAVFPPSNPWRSGWLVFLALLLVAAVRAAPSAHRTILVLPGAAVVFGMGALNLQVTPHVLQYQSTRAAAARSTIEGRPLLYHRTGEPSLHFAARTVVPAWNGRLLDRHTSIYTDRAGLADVRAALGSVRVIDSFPHIHVTRLSPRFVRPSTRPSAIEWRFLLDAPASVPLDRP